MDNSIVADFLKELITDYNRVSLPCLGSFLSEVAPAVISEGTIYPPSKSIVFHQNEIWNDEKLEKLIAETKKVSIGVAKEELAFWIDDVCVLLATGEDVVLPGLGKLFVSEQSKLMFEQESDNLLLESFGLEPILLNVKEEIPLTIPNPKNKKQKTKTSNKGLIIGGIIILLFAAAAGFAIFWQILSDKQVMPKIDIENIPVTNTEEIIYNEYKTPDYGILLSVFDKYSDAVKFSEGVTDTKIFCTDTEKPFVVIKTAYASQNDATNSLDSLKSKPLYAASQVVKLDTFKTIIP